MPIQKVKGGYRWGNSGKVYSTKEQALLQARAIYANMKKKGAEINEDRNRR